MGQDDAVETIAAEHVVEPVAPSLALDEELQTVLDKAWNRSVVLVKNPSDLVPMSEAAKKSGKMIQVNCNPDMKCRVRLVSR